MKEILSAWNLKTIQEWVNINRKLRDYNRTENDVIDYLKKVKENYITVRETGFVRKPIRRCPNCGGVLKLFSNNETTCHWECCKTCSSQPCGYIEQIDQPIEEVINLWNKENNNGTR